MSPRPAKKYFPSLRHTRGSGYPVAFLVFIEPNLFPGFPFSREWRKIRCSNNINVLNGDGVPIYLNRDSAIECDSIDQKRQSTVSRPAGSVEYTYPLEGNDD